MTKPEQLPFDLGHRTAHQREDFWISSANRDAVAWLDKWPEWPAPALLLFGPEACGKTHLLQVWKKDAEARAITAEELRTLQADQLVGDAHAVMLDDADTALKDKTAQETLFHVYNLLREKEGHLLLSARTPVKDWGLTLPDLDSRLRAAPAAALSPPDDQLMAVVLAKHFSDRQLFVPQEVVQFIVRRVNRSFASLRALAEQIDRRALAEKKPVTIPLIRDLL